MNKDALKAFGLMAAFVLIGVVAVFVVLKINNVTNDWQYQRRYRDSAQKQIRENLDPLEHRVRDLETRMERLEKK